MSASFPDSSIPAPAPRRSRHSLIVVILLVALGALAWQQLPDGRLHVFFPATRGDAMVIVTPRGGLVLVDGGNDPTTLTTALGRRLPFWRRDLDAVILTRTESRFVRGQVAALERYAPRMAILPTGRHTSTLLREWRRLLEAHRARLVTVETTRQLVIDGVMIRFFPTSSGLLVRLDYGGTSVLLAHAIDEAEVDRINGPALAPATLVAFPWEYDPRTAFVAALRPAVMVLTDGNESERPAQLSYALRAIGGATLYHERVDGAIEWVSDGRHWQIHREHLL